MKEIITSGLDLAGTNSTTASSFTGGSVQDQQFCLRWNNYHSNLSAVFDQLYQNGSFVDVTLVSEGRSIKAHKMVLAASSPYFHTIFFETPCEHPIVIIKDVKWEELKALVEFMYRGEINVSQEQIRSLLKLAEMFQIRGLTDVSQVEEQVLAPVSKFEQFTVYTALNSDDRLQNVHIVEQDSSAKRTFKDRDLARKQTLEAIDVPVEWPTDEAECAIDLNAENARKRKSLPSPNDEPIASFALATDHYPNVPTTISQPLIPTVPALQVQPSSFPADTQDAMMTTTLNTTSEPIDISSNSSQDWNTSSESRAKQKSPAWNWTQLHDAIAAVVTQRLRFTQASSLYNIPKGTLYDNILGKAHRMAILQELSLKPAEEAAVLDFCCDTAISPYNKRTKKSLKSILEFLSQFEAYRAKEDWFKFGGKAGFRWWWAFCRKHSIVSLYYEGMKQEPDTKITAKKPRKSMDSEDGAV